MNIRSLFYSASFLLFTGITIVQCQDGSGDMEDATDASGPIVYAAGREDYKAKYWKNGNAVALGKGSGTSGATGMVIVGDDVRAYEKKKDEKYGECWYPMTLKTNAQLNNWIIQTIK